MKKGGVYFIDVESGNLVYKLLMPDACIQDIYFISKDRVMVIITTGSPSVFDGDIYSSIVYLIDFKFGHSSANILNQIEFKKTHLDNIAYYENYFYITDQYNNKVIILSANELNIVGEMSGYDFPHGIDVNFGLVAVTNYGSNSVEIRSI